MNPVQLTDQGTHWDLLLQQDRVNVLGTALIAAIDQGLTEIEADPKPVLLHSSHRDFVLGADIQAFQGWFADNPAELNRRISATQHLFNRFSQLPAPTVAWVSGFALGGGFELALACDWRVVTADARVGLPEVTLGLCPAWGGTVRSVQLAGLEAAQQLMLSGRPIKGAQALTLGLVDQQLEQPSDVVEYLLSGLPAVRAIPPMPAPAPLEPIEVVDGQRAQAAIQALLIGNQDRTQEQALAAEVEAFVELAQSPESQALVQRYLNDQATKRAAKTMAATDSVIAYVGVVGAGIMGGGIAWQCALSGYTVMVRDVSAEALSAAQAEVQHLAQGALKKQRLTEAQISDIQARLGFSLELEALAPCDLIIEAVTEREDIKLAVLADADRITRDEAIVTSNTSTLSISGLAQAVSSAGSFAGLHFFNPVPLMPLVEVIRGSDSDDATLGQLVSFANRLGKRPVVVNDCPGFLVNRVLFPYLNAFDAMAAEGINVEYIDQVMTQFGWPMGPGVLADVIGIDTCVHASDVMAQGFPDRMPVPDPSALRERLASGHLGQKSGHGIYRFAFDQRGRTSPAGLSEPYAAAQQQLVADQIIERLMRPMVDELARCVDEGIVASAGVAETACLLGLGFPAWRGGPLYWGQQQGWVQGYY